MVVHHHYRPKGDWYLMPPAPRLQECRVIMGNMHDYPIVHDFHGHGFPHDHAVIALGRREGKPFTIQPCDKATRTNLIFRPPLHESIVLHSTSIIPKMTWPIADTLYGLRVLSRVCWCFYCSNSRTKNNLPYARQIQEKRVYLCRVDPSVVLCTTCL